MKNELTIKKNATASEVVNILTDLAKTFKEGKVCIESGKKNIVLKPSGDIYVEIEAEVKKDKEKLSIEMSWRQVEQQKEAESSLKISSTEPVSEPSDKEEDKGDD